MLGTFGSGVLQLRMRNILASNTGQPNLLHPTFAFWQIRRKPWLHSTLEQANQVEKMNTNYNWHYFKVQMYPSTYQEVARHPSRLYVSVLFHVMTLSELKLNPRSVRDLKLSMEAVALVAILIVYGGRQVRGYELHFASLDVDGRLLFAAPAHFLLPLHSTPILSVVPQRIRGLAALLHVIKCMSVVIARCALCLALAQLRAGRSENLLSGASAAATEQQRCRQVQW